MPSENGFDIQPDLGLPKRGRRVRYSQALDDTMQKMLRTPTPNACKAIWDRIDNGEYWELPRLAMEMERRDSQIRHVAESRRMSLRAVDWEILPNAESKEQSAAEDAAEYCREILLKIDSFRACLNHLVRAITDGISAVELIWERSELVDMCVVPYTRLRGHQGTSQILLETDESPSGEPMPRMKFVVRCTSFVAPHPVGVSLIHAASKLFCFKCVVTQDWGTFLDVYGIPARVFKTGANLEGPALAAAEDAMRQLSSDFWAVLNGTSEHSELTTLTPGSGSDVFENVAAWCDDSLARLYLMQTLTSDVRDSGSRSLGEVHQSTRADLLADDMMAESDDIEYGLLRPMIQLRFPGRDMPTPWFRRKLIERKNLDAERLQMEQLEMAIRQGLHIDEDVIRERLNIPIPVTKPQKRAGDQEVAVTINELTLGMERALRSGNVPLANALTAKISELLGVPIPPMPETAAMPKNNTQPKQDDGPEDDDADSNDDDVTASLRQRVLSQIAARSMSVDELCELLVLSEDKVRGVLNARELQQFLRISKVKGKPKRYRYVEN